MSDYADQAHKRIIGYLDKILELECRNADLKFTLSLLAIYSVCVTVAFLIIP